MGTGFLELEELEELDELGVLDLVDFLDGCVELELIDGAILGV